jgi:hypothetical protein
MFIFARKEWSWCPIVSRGRATRSCETAYPWSGMGLPAGLSSYPKVKTPQEWLRRNIPALSAPRIGPRGVQTSTPGLKIVGCSGGHGLPKASEQPGQSEEIPRESSGRDPLETVCAAIAEWPERLKACVETEGGNF